MSRVADVEQDSEHWRFKRVLQAVDVAILILSADCRVVFSNLTAMRLLGTSATIGQVPDLGKLARLPEFGDFETSVETTLTHPKGEIPVHVRHIPMPVRNGTERSLWIRDLSTGPSVVPCMQLHEMAVNAMTEGVAILNSDGEYLYMNDAHARMYGYQPAELIGRSWRTLYGHDAQLEFERSAFPELARSGRWSSGARGLHRDGSVVIVLVSLAQTGDFLVCCCQDVAERVKQAELLAETALSLEETNTKLQQAVRMKDEFLATVSHELRSPMHAILGAIELIGDSLPAEHRSNCEDRFSILAHSARHLHSLIDDLLDVSAMASGGVVMNFASVSASDLLESLVRLVSQQAAAKGITLRASSEPDDARFTVDERRVLQILVNLVSNAIEFTPQGGTIRVGIIQTAQQTMIRVEDTGCGIPEDQLGRIFDKFHQVDGSLSRQHEGSGLGLYLVQQLAALHGGTVAVKSAVGQGSLFTVTLPSEQSGG